jgi:hypothetical protein
MGGMHAGIANDGLSPVLEDTTRTTDFLTGSEECQAELWRVCHLLHEIPDREASNVHRWLNYNRDPASNDAVSEHLFSPPRYSVFILDLATFIPHARNAFLTVPFASHIHTSRRTLVTGSDCSGCL